MGQRRFEQGKETITGRRVLYRQSYRERSAFCAAVTYLRSHIYSYQDALSLPHKGPCRLA